MITFLKNICFQRDNPYFETYNKTISYLRESHTSPKIQSSKKLINSVEQDGSMFNEKMEDELEKFNKMKSQKQKEAKFQYEEEIKRLKTMQDLKEKEERIIKLNENFKQEKVS